MDKFPRVFQKSPLNNGQPPPPPTALGRQFSVSTAAPPKRVPSLHHCISSDGGLAVEKYLQRQAIAHEWSLWRKSMALNLIHGIGESLSAGGKAGRPLRHRPSFNMIMDGRSTQPHASNCWDTDLDTLSTLGSLFSSIPPYRVARDSGT